MGANQGTSRLMAQISDDSANIGFDGDDVLDMQQRIGTVSSLKRNLACSKADDATKFSGHEDIFAEDLANSQYFTRAQSTQESLSGMENMHFFSEEDIHHQLFDSCGSHPRIESPGKGY